MSEISAVFIELVAALPTSNVEQRFASASLGEVTLTVKPGVNVLGPGYSSWAEAARVLQIVVHYAAATGQRTLEFGADLRGFHAEEDGEISPGMVRALEHEHKRLADNEFVLSWPVPGQGLRQVSFNLFDEIRTDVWTVTLSETLFRMVTAGEVPGLESPDQFLDAAKQASRASRA